MTRHREPRPRRLLRTVGHFTIPAWPIAPLAIAGLELAGLYHGIAISAAFAVFTITALTVATIHDLNRCARCTWTVPLRGAARAKRYRHLLRLRHLLKERPVRAGSLYLAAYVVGMLATLAVAESLFDVGDHALVHAGVALIHPPVALLVVLRHLHRRVQLWCPYCRLDGDDPTSRTGGSPGPRDVTPMQIPH